MGFFEQHAKRPAIKFENGDKEWSDWLTMTDIELMGEEQCREYVDDGVGDLKFWDDEKTQPIMQYVIKGKVDGEERHLFIQESTSLKDAFIKALMDAGAKNGPADGGTIRIRRGPRRKRKPTSKYTSFQFEVEYAAPEGGGFFGKSDPEPPAGNSKTDADLERLAREKGVDIEIIRKLYGNAS